MKTQKLKFILIIFTILTCISTICFATDTAVTTSEGQTDTSTTTESEISTTTEIETHVGDYFKTGNDITLDQAIDGNAFIMGKNVTLTGAVNGDLYVLASESLNLALGSQVLGNVFAISPKINMEGVVYSLYAVTDNYTCAYDGMAALDLKVFANKIDFSGYIERHVYFVASDSLTINSDGYIAGNLNYTANNVTVNENATIKGETFADKYEGFSNVATPATIIANYTTSFITTLTFLLVVLLAILLVKPNIIKSTSQHLTTKPFKTLGFGALAFIAIPILAVVCLFFEALTTAALILAVIYFVLLCLSTIIVTIGLAQFLDKKIQKTYSDTSILAYILIVGVAFWALTQIPFVGVIFSIIIWIFGLGTIVVSLLPNKKEENSTELSETQKPEKIEEPKKVEEPKKEKKSKDKKDSKEENKTDEEK